MGEQPPSAPDLVARYEDLKVTSDSYLLGDWAREAVAEIERLTLGWEKTARDQQQEIERLRAEKNQKVPLSEWQQLVKENERLREVRDELTRQAAKRQTEQRQEIERLTRERDELKADLTSKDPMHMDSAGRWESAAMRYAHERDRLRAALEEAIWLLCAATPNVRVLLEGEAEWRNRHARWLVDHAGQILRGAGEK